MNNYTALSFYYGFYSKPQGGYPPPNHGAISISNPPVVIRAKGSKNYRPASKPANQMEAR